MSEWDIVILGGLIVLFLSLIYETLESEEPEETFIDKLYWKGQLILLGDLIIIKTPYEQVEGYFRGIIVREKQWIFRLSRDGEPKLELNWYDIIEVKKIKLN